MSPGTFGATGQDWSAAPDLALVTDDQLMGELARRGRFMLEQPDDVLFDVPACRVCGCTDTDCSGCVELTGIPCEWVEYDLCSACVVRRFDVQVVEYGTHTDEHGVTHGSVTLWGTVEDLVELGDGPAVLELRR